MKYSHGVRFSEDLRKLCRNRIILCTFYFCFLFSSLTHIRKCIPFFFFSSFLFLFVCLSFSPLSFFESLDSHVIHATSGQGWIWSRFCAHTCNWRVPYFSLHMIREIETDGIIIFFQLFTHYSLPTVVSMLP